MRTILFSLSCIGLAACGIYYLYTRPMPPAPPSIGFLSSNAAAVELRVGKTSAVVRAAECNVRFDMHHPGGKGLPAVVLVHAQEHVAGAAAEWNEQHVRDLVAAGFVVMVVHYQAHAPETWGAIFLDLVGRLRRITCVDPDRIGVAGFFRGAPIALVVGSNLDCVGGVAVYGARMPSGFATGDARRLPRTLMILGEEDLAAVATMNAFEGWFRELEKPYDIHLQKGIGGKDIPEDARHAAWNRMLRFFREYL